MMISQIWSWWWLGLCLHTASLNLQWRNNERHALPNHQHIDCLLNRLFRRTPKKTSKLRFIGLCEGNPPVTGGFPSQMANNAENFFNLTTSSWSHKEIFVNPLCDWARCRWSWKHGSIHHYIDVIMITMASQTPTSRLFTQSFIRAQVKENIKAPRHWPLCGEFTGTGEFPAQRTSNAENVSIWWRHHVMGVSYQH